MTRFPPQIIFGSPGYTSYHTHTDTRSHTSSTAHGSVQSAVTAWVCLFCMSPFVHMKITQSAATCCRKGGWKNVWCPCDSWSWCSVWNLLDHFILWLSLRSRLNNLHSWSFLKVFCCLDMVSYKCATASSQDAAALHNSVSQVLGIDCEQLAPLLP